MTRLAIATDHAGRHAVVVQGRTSRAPRLRVVGVCGMFAHALLDRGVALWSHRTASSCGRPGLVLFDEGIDARAELRADVADPTTVVATGSMPAADARACLPEGRAVPIADAKHCPMDAPPPVR